MNLKISPRTKRFLREAIREDVGGGDITTRTFISPKVKGSAMMISHGAGVLAGTPVVQELFRLVNPKIKQTWHRKDGSKLKPGLKICTLSGSLASILKAERVALNFLARLSGIASVTSQFVARVKGTGVRVCDTRKTTPLWRELEKYAVRVGGGINHRMGLWETGFVKDNHWKLVQNAGEMVEGVRKLARRGVIIEVHREHLKFIPFLLQGKPSVILFDNLVPAEIKQAVRSVKKHCKKGSRKPLLEVSGRVDLRNVNEIAKTGVDRISVGALTHSAPAADFSLEVVRCLR